MDVIRRIAFCRAAFLLPLLAFAPVEIRAGEVSSTNTAATLEWSAPGDDGMAGRATRYDLRYWHIPINAANFHLAHVATGVPTPGTPGTTQSTTVTGLATNMVYYFALKTVDDAGNWSKISNIVVRTAPLTATNGGPMALSLSAPWPNPARQTTRWSYQLPHAALVQLEAFDIAGRHVRTIASGSREAGDGDIEWDLRDDSGNRLGNGVYLVRARLGDQMWTRRVTIVR